MAAITKDDITAYLHELFEDRMVEFMVPREYPLFDTIAKNPNGGGDSWSVTVATSGGQGVAGTDFSKAQTNAGAGESKKFSLSFGSCFAVMQILEKTIRHAEKDESKFLDELKIQGEGVLRTKGSDLSVQLWGNGGAPLGQIATGGISSNTITLENKDDVINFFVGQVLVASNNDGSAAAHTLLDSGDTMTVTAVDHASGTITTNAVANIAGLAAADYLFREGQFAGNVSQEVIMKGVRAWNPTSDPASSENFFSVDRSTNDYLSGARVPTTLGGNQVERLRKAANFHHSRFGATSREVWVHPRQWEVISIILGQNGYRIIEKRNSTGTFGYKGLEMMCAYGDVSVMSDRHAPLNRYQFMNPSTMELVSMGGIMTGIDRDGLELKPLSSQPGYEKRWCTFAQLSSWAPRDFCTGAFPTLAEDA